MNLNHGWSLKEKIFPTHAYNYDINTNEHQLDSWIFDYESVQLVISDQCVLVIVRDKFLLDYYQFIELLRSSIILVNKYTPRTYFFLKRYLSIKYASSTLDHNQNIEIKNGVSQGYFFLKRCSMVE